MGANEPASLRPMPAARRCDEFLALVVLERRSDEPVIVMRFFNTVAGQRQDGQYGIGGARRLRAASADRGANHGRLATAPSSAAAYVGDVVGTLLQLTVTRRRSAKSTTSGHGRGDDPRAGGAAIKAATATWSQDLDHSLATSPTKRVSRTCPATGAGPDQESHDNRLRAAGGPATRSSAGVVARNAAYAGTNRRCADPAGSLSRRPCPP